VNPKIKVFQENDEAKLEQQLNEFLAQDSVHMTGIAMSESATDEEWNRTVLVMYYDEAQMQRLNAQRGMLQGVPIVRA
jgi:hypothetical protein